MVGVLGAPLFGRIIDRVNPWYAIVIATSIMLLSKAIYWGAAGVNLAVVVTVCVGLDIARQSQQVAIATQVFQVEEGMRSRINSLCIFSVCARSSIPISKLLSHASALDVHWASDG